MCVTVVLLSLLLCTTRSEDLPNLQTLKLVQVIFRHGDRSPTKSYPTNPYGNASIYWPMGLGQLTQVGKYEQFKLGQYLRLRYDDFVPMEYNSQEIQIMSSEEPRVVQSAQYTLAGLFGNGASAYSKSTATEDILKWVQSSVLIKTLPKLEDNILALKKPCERMDQIYSDSMHGNHIENFSEENKTLVEYVRKHAGFSNETSLNDVLQVEDVITIGNIHNLSMPDWMNSTMLNNLRQIRLEFGIQETSTTQLKRLRSGPLLEILLNNMENIVDENAKFVMYSAHDSTMVSLMDTLGVLNSIIPAYSSAILIELHKSFDTYWVEMLYRNDSQRNPFQLVLPGCTIDCSLVQLVNLTSDFIPTDWDAECTTSSELKESVNMTISVSGTVRFDIIMLISLGAVVVVAALIFIHIRRSRKDSRFGKEMKRVYGSTLDTI